MRWMHPKYKQQKQITDVTFNNLSVMRWLHPKHKQQQK